MRLIADSEQQFNKWSRHLVTMEKLVEATDATPTASSKPAHFDFRDRYFSKFA
jgi:hypothetical protein